jgi:DNA-binding transcriptional LysR family regulator
LTADSGTTAANVERLRSGELDLAFIHSPIQHATSLGCVDTTMEPLVVALPSTHPLSPLPRVPREAQASVPPVYFPRSISPGLYDHSLAQVYGPSNEPNIARKEPSEERMLVAVAEGAGITLIVEDRAATLRFSGGGLSPVCRPRADSRTRHCFFPGSFPRHAAVCRPRSTVGPAGPAGHAPESVAATTHRPALSQPR